MEPYQEKIRLYPRKKIFTAKIESWPRAKRHQFYTYSPIGSALFALSNSFKILDAIGERPGIDGLRLKLRDLIESDEYLVEVEALLTRNDRSWHIVLDWDFQQAHRGPTRLGQSSLRSALSVFRSVQYLSLCDGTNRDEILNNLPTFEKLKCLDLRRWAFDSSTSLEEIRDYSFLPQVRGISLPSLHDFYEIESVFDNDTAKLIRTINVAVGADSTYYMDVLEALPKLKQLNVTVLPHEETPSYMVELRTLFRCLESPKCPVSELILEFRNNEDQILTVLEFAQPAAVSKSVRLRILGQDMKLDDLFQDLLLKPIVKSVEMSSEGFEEEQYVQIFKFQCQSRPRLFPIQFLGEDRKLEFCEEDHAQKIRHVSYVFESLINIEHSRKVSPIPLCLWSRVLEKLGSAFDSRSIDAHAIGADALYGALRELLGMQHRVMRWQWHDGGLGISPSTVSPAVSRNTGNARKRKRQRRF